ncbi:MAG TPA: hypothetical protein DEQ09_00065 [Bacteroidales bacterium]|nr:hypothetical protein [Bacteroidales bacterium]
MKRKTIFIVLLSLLVLSSCINERYDMDKLSGEVALNPSVILKAVKGEMTLSNVVEPNDTLVFDNELLKFVFREDSIINFQLEDFYSSFETTTFESTTQITSITVSDERDTLFIDPGDDIKIKKMKVLSGQANYTIRSWCSFDVSITLEATSIDDGGAPLTQSVTVPAGSTVNGIINMDGVLANFDTNPSEPYNQLPFEYDITVLLPPGSYDPSDSVKVSIDLEEPEFDYATGYFGNHNESSEKDTLDLDMEDFFSKLSGSIYLTSPSITIDYTNSFGLPMRINTEVKGINDEQEISLDRDPVDIDYPNTLDNREVSSSFTIDKTNSTLPDLISMLPYEIEYFGSGSINPDGEHLEDNIIFGSSSFIADMEVEIPLEFRISNLQLSDTTDNFLISDDPEEDDLLDMMEELTIRLYAENGFPLGASAILELYDSTSMTVLETIDTGDLLLPAPVDANGRVTGPSTGNAEIEFTPGFLDAAQVADQIIISFILNTTDNGTKDVKIYSDYNIVFSIAVKVKADINLNFNSEDE